MFTQRFIPTHLLSTVNTELPYQRNVIFSYDTNVPIWHLSGYRQMSNETLSQGHITYQLARNQHHQSLDCKLMSKLVTPYAFDLLKELSILSSPKITAKLLFYLKQILTNWYFIIYASTYNCLSFLIFC